MRSLYPSGREHSRKLISFDELPEILTTRQVSEWLQIDINTVSLWIRKGTLNAIRFPGSSIYRIEKKALKELIEELRSGESITTQTESKFTEE